MSQEEPSIIDYARFHGLVRDHLEDDPLQQHAPSVDIISSFDDSADLFQICNDSVKVPDERLTFDQGAASLLSSVLALAQHPHSPHKEDDDLDTHRVRRMKHDVPLLRSDPKIDQLRFAPRIVPNLEHEFLPMETVDEEADEGVGWPSRCYSLRDEYAKKSKTEKLEVTSDALAFLQATLRSHQQDEELRCMEEVERPYTRKIKVQPMSPPLLPRSPEVLPYVPSSDTGRVELLSDQTSPTRDEAREIDKVIFADDAIPRIEESVAVGLDCSHPLFSDTCDFHNLIGGYAEPLSSSPIPKRPLQNRKVEVPLSPAQSEQLPPWRKHVSGNEVFSEVIRSLPPPIPRPENVSSDDIDALFDETIRPIGIKGERSIEQERLLEADTTLRVTVPVMDFSSPVAPWKAVTRSSSTAIEEASKESLNEMKVLHFSNHDWRLSGKVERELKWTPFPAALGKVAHQETICDDKFIEKYLEPPERVDINTLTWKPADLRILDELAESNDELEEGTFPDEKDIDSLIRKRKYEYDLDADDSNSVSLDGAYKTIEKERPNEQGKGNTRKAQVELSTDQFSAIGALDNYMGVRKGGFENTELTVDKFVKKLSQQIKAAESTKAIGPMSAPPATNNDDNIREKMSLPSPEIIVSTQPVPFVVSSSFFDNRRLARQVQRLYPSAELIERDFNAHLDPPTEAPAKGKPVLTTQTTALDEADLIISPSVGLMWTTLQKIKQRSLPGQATRSPVKERIAKLCARYERLIVLIHENRTTTPLDHSDCEALIDLSSFCSSLESEVHITFVAGSEDELAKWVVAMMIKFGITNENLRLIQDETLWEVFLRRAGMNAFAAQAILAELKPREQAEGGISDQFGLAAFLRMSMMERFARFETLLGGQRLLARVSKVLNAKW
ncbi:hypothetical protein ACLMJK_003606 [Lecanora helva]